jgi:thiol-disulfide isomerase/thioredoxin
MKRILILVLAVAAVALFTSLFAVHATAADKAASEKSTTAKAATAPADRVVVMYFHRTQRCPTCLRMGTYSEESVKEKFAGAMKEGKVEFHYIDFQDKKNEALTKGYKVGGPTLIVAKVNDNKIKEFKNLKDIWAKNSDKKGFYKYVQENITAYAK